MKRICIVIPAYNEEKRIRPMLESYARQFSELVKQKKIESYQLLVVINNTQDKTESVVQNIQKKYSAIKYLNFKRGGKGFAVLEGFKEAMTGKWDYIGFVDADGATPAEAYYDLFEHRGKYAGIIASRYVPHANVNPKPTFSRIVVSRMFNVLTRILLGLPYKDTQCGAKIFTREAVQCILKNVATSQWAFDVDILYQLKRNGFSVREFPTTWNDKEYSKINFLRAGPMMALAIIRIRLIHSPFKKVIGIYDFLSNIYKKL